MIQTLKDNYSNFHDALVIGINYNNGYNFSSSTFEQASVEIILSCYNIKRDNGIDLISIYCEDVISMIYEKWDGMIFETLISEENGEIILDFSSESVRDYFVVKCKNVTCHVLEQK